jgi:hypothetical protein
VGGRQGHSARDWAQRDSNGNPLGRPGGGHQGKAKTEMKPAIYKMIGSTAKWARSIRVMTGSDEPYSYCTMRGTQPQREMTSQKHKKIEYSLKWLISVLGPIRTQEIPLASVQSDHHPLRRSQTFRSNITFQTLFWRFKWRGFPPKIPYTFLQVTVSPSELRDQPSQTYSRMYIFVVDLVSLSITQTLLRRNVPCLMNNEFEYRYETKRS